MLKRVVVWLLMPMLVASSVVSSPVLAASKAEKGARRIEKLKAEVAKLGAGRDARIVVRLKDKSLIAGYVKSVSDEAFVVSDLKDSSVTYVPYPDITAVKGHNLSNGAWIAIGVVAAVAVVALVLVLVPCRNEGGCGA